VSGYEEVAKKLKAQFSGTPILLGGAGGYLPDSITPEVWSKVALTLS
jgi:hypothetical protein